jgi:hypothetical protein
MPAQAVDAAQCGRVRVSAVMIPTPGIVQYFGDALDNRSALVIAESGSRIESEPAMHGKLAVA